MIRPIFQSRKDDCLNACIATMTGLNLGVLNDLCADPADLCKLGLSIVEISVGGAPAEENVSCKLPFSFPVPVNEVYLKKEVIIGTLLENTFHAVVGQIVIDHGKTLLIEVTHDPDPERNLPELPEGFYKVVSILLLTRLL